MFHRFRSFSRRHGRIPKGMLERSVFTYKNGFRHRIVTLDPNKFAEKKQQCLHIGNLQSFKACCVSLKQPTSVVTSELSYAHTNSRIEKSKKIPYPPDTKAFLYYYMPPEKPRIAGELRLRVTSSNDTAFFESGWDLLRPDGQIWSRPLFQFSKALHPLYERLREDRLIPDDLNEALAALPKKKFHHSRSHYLYTLNDTFIVDFSSHGKRGYFWVVTEQGMQKLRLQHTFTEGPDVTVPYTAAYTGNALARFERSTLPDHIGTRTVVLRFLKIITPVKCVIPLYDGNMSCPKEGELYERRHAGKKRKVWSVDIDKVKGPDSCGPGLKLLWDA